MSFRQWVLPISAASVAGLTYYDRFARMHVYTFQHKDELANVGNGRFYVRGVVKPEMINGLEHEMGGTIIKLKRVD